MNQPDKPLLNVFCNSKPVKALCYIKENEKPYSREIATEIDTTQSHSVKMLQRLEEHGTVTSEKKTRRKEYQLTEIGETLADALQTVIKSCENLDDTADTDEPRPGVSPA